MSRPTIITDELIETFCSKLRISGSIETAIQGTGISRQSYYRWARQVREGCGTPMVKRFVKAVEKSEGEMKLMREQMLTLGYGKSWRLCARWLEQHYPREYGRRRPSRRNDGGSQRPYTAARPVGKRRAPRVIITDELIARFCAMVRDSGSIETAILDSGISREIYHELALQIREGRGTPAAKRLIKAVDKAESDTKLLREHMLSKHFEKNWRSLKWWLERKFPGEYGRRRPPLLDQDGEQVTAERIIWTKKPVGGEAGRKKRAAGPDEKQPPLAPPEADEQPEQDPRKPEAEPEPAAK